MKNNLNHIGQVVALLSFVIGTSLLAVYLFFGEEVVDIGFTLTFVVISTIINFIVFITVVINGLFSKNHKKEALVTCGLMVLNIPIAILYFYMIATFPNQNILVMTLKINKIYLKMTLVILLIEICIAAFLTGGFIRYTFGDFLSVILVYCGIRSFMEANPIYIAISVLIFAFLIEFSQLYNLLDYLHLRDHKLVTILLGSSFHISDLIAYTLGTLTILFIDLKTTLWKP